MRLIAPHGGTAYEVDLPGNVAAKRKRLMATFGRVPDRVRLVPTDFEHDAAAEVKPLLGTYGWAVIEDVGPADYTQRYLAPAGRELPVMEIERFVRATKIT